MNSEKSKKFKYDVRRICNDISLSDVVARVCPDLKKRGQEYWARCPFHAEKTPSFTLYNKGSGWRYKCHGCGEGGDVITFVSKIQNIDFKAACEALTGGSEQFRLSADMSASNRGRGENSQKLKEEEAQEKEARRQFAWGIWQESSRDIHPLSKYLLGRNIDLALINGFPQNIRFHPQLRHKNGNFYPAMVSAVTDIEGKFLAVHRTYLSQCLKKKADVDKAKIVAGPMRGGKIELYPAEDHDTVMLAEGIETALSVRCVYPKIPVWTAVSLSNFKAVQIPHHIKHVVVLGDNDMKPPKPGQKDPKEIMEEGACLIKEQVKGRRVTVIWADEGKDFNDMVGD